MRLPFRLWRLYWLVRLRWRGHQLTQMQRRAGAILLACHATRGRLDAIAEKHAKQAKG